MYVCLFAMQYYLSVGQVKFRAEGLKRVYGPPAVASSFLTVEMPRVYEYEGFGLFGLNRAEPLFSFLGFFSHVCPGTVVVGSIGECKPPAPSRWS